jgi:predicted aconitase
MRVVVEMGELLGAPRLIEITSAHIDGCLYHGDGGVEFAQRLVEDGARVAVPTTLNVGALDLLNPSRVNADPHSYQMARRQMAAYETMGCAPTWTCAPYQAGHRPGLGEHVAWGESNAVAFANSVLGARTNRYGDFMDICCAVVARAPYVGLHTDEGRLATVVVDTSAVSDALKDADVFFPVLGSWLGRVLRGRTAVIDGLPPSTSEDRLKALGAAAATTGAVGLFHVAGITPEARRCGPPGMSCRRWPENRSTSWRWAARTSRWMSSPSSRGCCPTVAFGSRSTFVPAGAFSSSWTPKVAPGRWSMLA